MSKCSEVRKSIHSSLHLADKIRLNLRKGQFTRNPFTRWEKDTAFYYQQTDRQGDSKIKEKKLFGQLSDEN